MVRKLLTALATAAIATVAAGSASANTPGNAYTVHELRTTANDASLVNAWGLVAGPTTPWWVSNNKTGVATIYEANGTTVIPPVDTGSEAPTGTVFNVAGSGFVVTSGTKSGSARFLFDGEDGVITGWNPAVSPDAQVAVSNPTAIYKGLAYAITATGPRLYAADFHNARVDVYDASWHPVTMLGAFTDPALPSGYAPFGIQAIGNRIFVTFAKQDAEASDEVAGQGLGFVDAFDTDGLLLARVAQHGQLNAPWGLALAPASFGAFGGDLLVGSFGDGTINAYAELGNGRFEYRGQLRGADNAPVTIDGLWALEFGLSARSGGTGTLFFTAGPEDETLGLFGSISPGSP